MAMAPRRILSLMVPSLLVALLALGGHAVQAQGAMPGMDAALPAADSLPVVQFQQGRRLQDLPGAATLAPADLRPSIDIVLTPATITGPDGGANMLNFTNGLYRDATTGEMFLFGPTVRGKAGDTLSIRLSNNLTAPAEEHAAELNGFHNPTATNLHTHGLHDPPGVQSQVEAAQYLGQDNIFVTLPAKPTPDAEPASYVFNGSIAQDHMPGLHWYHPHKHGATTIQVFTANGLIIVEDDPAWLPDQNGCSEVRGLLEAAPEVILHLGLMTFAPVSQQLVEFFKNDTLVASVEDANPQVYSQMAIPENRLCCDEPGQTAKSLPLTGDLSDTDFILVNGGYQPIIPMMTGQFQRWRLAHTGYKRFVDLKILDPDTQLPTEDCEMHLLAKDGIYLMQIPRVVDHIFLTSGNRAELLVRCNGSPGQKYILTSGGTNHSAFGSGFLGTVVSLVQANQEVVATIELEDPQGAAPQDSPSEKACTPLRAGYASDLRDSALSANGVNSVLFQQAGFTPGSGGCQVNGRSFTFPDETPLTMPLGSVIEWNFTNAHAHPLHLHVNPIQITKLYEEFLVPGTNYTSWFEEGDWQDTIQIPVVRVIPGQGFSTVGLRTQPGEYAGYSVLHCHFLSHEDNGCMAVVKWECPGYDGDAQPKTCPGFTFPSPGTFPKEA